MTETIQNKNTENKMTEGSRAVLVGAVTQGTTTDEVEAELEELSGLLDTAGGTAVARVIQNLQTPDPRTLIGSGKVKEIAGLCKNEEADLVVFDVELSPSQIRNLEEEIGGDVRVIDRSMLILDIFALHATTGEGKMQVELAQLQYTAPRLTGNGKDLSRLGGGIGTRGPGESKLETDRRHMKRRMEALRAELDDLERTRKTMRATRDKSGVPKVAIVGYTNAGKSTLLNRLTGAGILAEDKLFATLDPTTRKYTLPGGERILLSDTVGFIRKLPHHLIKAFRSTLDEAVYADILLVLVDASDPEYRAHLKVTEELLSDLGAGEKPTLFVFNKCDRTKEPPECPFPKTEGVEVAYISAATGEGVDEMIAKLTTLLHEGKKKIVFRIPNADAGALNTLYRNATVETVEYTEDGMLVTATVDEKTRGMLRRFDPTYPEPEQF